MMKSLSWLLPLAVIALVPAATLAKSGEKPAAARTQSRSGDYIAFANHGGVRDWREGGKDVIYFQGRNRQWFKAELSSPSFDLPFTLFVGLDTGPSDRLDRWSAVYIKGQRYFFKSFARIVGLPPDRRSESKKRSDTD